MSEEAFSIATVGPPVVPPVVPPIGPPILLKAHSLSGYRSLVGLRTSTSEPAGLLSHSPRGVSTILLSPETATPRVSPLAKRRLAPGVGLSKPRTSSPFEPAMEDEARGQLQPVWPIWPPTRAQGRGTAGWRADPGWRPGVEGVGVTPFRRQIEVGSGALAAGEVVLEAWPSSPAPNPTN